MPSRPRRNTPPAALRSLALSALAPFALSCTARDGASGSLTGEGFVGAETCATCHAPEQAAWSASQHARAMQPALPGTVLGRFDGSRFTSGNVISTFLRRGERFVVRTDGPDGLLQDFEVRYTFGIWPVQQYLVDLPGGRMQPLSLAWDARPDSLGGQRWFSLDPEPGIAATDELHWTAWENNWNYMCADCHSTGVRKRYDAPAHQFRTVSAEVNVACEACHGPGARHTRWAGAPRWLRSLLWRDNGLPAPLTERRGARWVRDSSLRTAYRSEPRRTDREIEVCAQCHSRRVQFADGYTAGEPWLDFHDPAMLTDELFHADGQQEDEVFVYASFLQSKMYAAGVTCADCHDPHGGKTRLPGNQVCTQCHAAAAFDTTAHHFHQAGGAGAACVACHMPPTTYMQVDPRRDHSMRVPRPDLSVRLGVPDACSGCHADRNPTWAARQVQAWYGHTPAGFQRFAGAFAADDRAAPGAEDSLRAIESDSTQPVIVRASALARLGRHPGRATHDAARAAARHAHPLLRRASLHALEGFPPDERVEIATSLLDDEARVVRTQAAWLLAPVADSLTDPAQRRRFEAAAAEFVASQRYNADRSSRRLTLGTYYAQRGRLDSAMVEYRAALRLAPKSVEAYLNIAGLLSMQGAEPEAEQTLRDALALIPGDPMLHHALGLSLARAGRLDAALPQLEQAARRSPAASFAHVYAVALHRAGRVRDAIRALEAARSRHPTDREVLYALAAYNKDVGETAAAIRHARQLARLYPDDAQAIALLRSLEPGGR